MSGSVRMARETGWSSVAWYLLENTGCLSSFQRRAWDRGLIARAFVQALLLMYTYAVWTACSACGMVVHWWLMAHARSGS